MVETAKHAAWQLALAQRDLTLTQLANIAAALVLAWVLLDYLPPREARWLRRLYLLGGLPLFLVTLFVSAFSKNGG